MCFDSEAFCTLRQAMQSVCLRMFKISSITHKLIGWPLKDLTVDWLTSSQESNENEAYKQPWETNICHMYPQATPTKHKYKQRSAVLNGKPSEYYPQTGFQRQIAPDFKVKPVQSFQSGWLHGTSLQKGIGNNNNNKNNLSSMIM